VRPRTRVKRTICGSHSSATTLPLRGNPVCAQPAAGFLMKKPRRTPASGLAVLGSMRSNADDLEPADESLSQRYASRCDTAATRRYEKRCRAEADSPRNHWDRQRKPQRRDAGLPTVLGCGRTDCRGAAMPGTCHECKRPLIVIDNRGEHLVGCLSYNLWCDRDGNAVRLSEEDLAALHALRK